MSDSHHERRRLVNRIIQKHYGLPIRLASSVVDSYFRLVPRKRLSEEERGMVQIIAHRGCHNGWAGVHENTMQAFDIALESGVWGIEFDVQWTSDNVPVVCHDPHTAGNPHWTGVEIGRSSFDELRLLCPEVPSLKEVVERFGKRMHLMIEIKKDTVSHAGADVLISVLAGLKPVADYHLMVLDAALIQYLDAFPEQSRLLIATTNTRQMFTAALSHENEIGGLTGHYLLLSKRMRRELRLRDLKWGTGYVDSMNLLAREIRSGCSWIFSEFADELTRQAHAQH